MQNYYELQTDNELERLAYTPEELTKILGLSRCFVYKLLKEGKIASIRLGKRIIIPKEAVINFLRQASKQD